MLKLEPVSDDALATYDAIVARKRPKERRERLQKLRSRVKSAYAQYYRQTRDLERIRPDRFSSDRDDLLGCYNGSTAPRNELYAKVKALSGYWCAYCTAYTTATLDHYLPKEPYPEYCVLPVNLVPACSGCNRSRDFRDSRGKRALVHPYFDPVPATARLLIVVVDIKQDLPRARFSVNTSMRSAFAKLYARHFKLLSLRKRYSDAAVPMLGEAVRSVRSWGAGLTCKEAGSWLAKQAAAEEQVLGANYFKAALLRGAANSKAFLDYCVEAAT
jgi:5-methylcytosine-specific restriction endonuclease McrA